MRPLLMTSIGVLLMLATSLCVQQVAASVSAPNKVCMTPECLALSALITSNINQSADPCEDFNAYACGHYRENTLYDPTSLTWSGTDEPLMLQTGLGSVQKQLKKRLFELLFFHRPVRGEDPDVSVMYRLASSLSRSCTGWFRRRNRRGMPNNDMALSRIYFNGILTHLLESSDLFDWRKPSGSFEKALAKMVRFDIWPMFRVGPTFRHRRQLRINGTADRNIARIYLSYDLLWQLDPNTSDTILDSYTNFFKTLPAASILDFDKPKEFVSIIRRLNYNATLSAKNSCISEQVLKSRKTDFTIRELDSISKCVDPETSFSWAPFFEGIFDGRVDKDTLIEFRSPTYAIQINNLVAYFKKLSLTKSGGKLSVHFSFLVFSWLLSLPPLFPDALEAQWDKDPIKFRRPMPAKGEDPIDECMMLTKSMLGPVVERMFQKSYHDENFQHVLDMIGLLQNASIKSVREAEWITPSSKDAIVDKIVSLKKDIGFQLVTVSNLKNFYASTIRAFGKENFNSSYRSFGTLLSFAMCASAGRSNNLLTSDSTSDQFAIPDTLTVNAFYNGMKNNIVFPMGILSPFIYHRNFPDYMNLGGIGVIIGHEIGHGFDDMGHELNKLGVRGHFWDNKTERGFLERMQCVLSRFGSYELVPGQRHNPNTTLGNDIADLMGIRSAFGALQLLGSAGRSVQLPNLPASLTPERLFFVQAAQVWCAKTEPNAITQMFVGSSHSPPHIRIRGMMENSRDFARVFQCRSDHKMNPKSKCEFW